MVAADAQRDSRFLRETCATGQTSTLYFSGEWDIAIAPLVCARVSALIEKLLPGDEVVIDISGVSFCDASGLRAALEFVAVAKASDVKLQIVDAQQIVVRLFEIVGLSHLLEREVPR